jgi:putative ABC transport system permease protein
MPDWRAYVKSKLPPLGLGPGREAEIVDELAQELEQCHASALGRGAGEDDAARAAMEEIPDWGALAREIRAAEGPIAPAREPSAPGLGRDLSQDIRYGLRALGQAPAFTLLCVLTLALGIGATTAMFAVVNAVLLRPLPFDRPGELVRLWNSWGGYPNGSISDPELHDWRERARTFSGVAAWSGHGASSLAVPGGEPETVTVASTSANFFDVLGARPARGRTFLPGEDAAGRNGVVVIGDGLWRRRFGADPSVVGRTVSLQGETVAVVGVMPAAFAFPGAGTDLWQPAPLDPHQPRPRGNHYLRVVARLAPGQGPREGQAELDVIAAQMRVQYADTYAVGSGFAIRLQPLREQMLGPVTSPLLLLLGAVGLVLAIACANVASLMLARGTGRGREIAIRTALGAGRARIARQLLVESLLVAFIGGAAGVAAAQMALPLLLALAPETMPRLAEVRIDGPVWAAAGALTLLTGVVFGLFPVWQSTRADANQLLKSGRTGAIAGARRPQKMLVVAETALAMMLLFGAGLLLRSFAKLLDEEPGFDARGVATASISLPPARYKREEAGPFFERLRRSLEESPATTSAAIGNNPPLSGWMNDNLFVIEGYTPRRPGDRPGAEYREVSAGYFRTLRIPILSGREFTEEDDAQHLRVAIVSRSLALKYWGSENPVGRRIRRPDDPPDQSITIVGVAGDVKQTRVNDAPLPTLYAPHLQGRWSTMSVFVRAAADAQASVGDIARHVRRLDAGLAVSDARLLQDLAGEALAAPRFNLRLLGLFAALAVSLAGIGTFGVMRYIVDQRTSEIGIRMALGAGRSRVLAEVLREGLTLAVAGLTLGLLGALLLTRAVTSLSSLLHGVAPTDPLTAAAVVVLLLAMALAACWAPARRATGVDPTVALRGE